MTADEVDAGPPVHPIAAAAAAQSAELSRLEVAAGAHRLIAS